MKQAKIEYRETTGGYYQFVGFKDVLTLPEIVEALGWSRSDEYLKSQSFFSIPKNNIQKTDVIRVFGPANGDDQRARCKDFAIGNEYKRSEWFFFIGLLRKAGTRFSKLHGDLKKVYTVKI